MKRFISLAVSLVILGIIYVQIDFEGLVRVLQNCHPFWMAVSLLMVIPTTGITAWRLQQLVPHSVRIGFAEANRLILAASVLNMILPSKMGDIAKAYFIKQRGHLEGSLALSLVVFEKACDLLSLLLWCVFGLALYPEKDLFFWGMTGGVALLLAIAILLLASRKFARLFFRVSKRISPAKLRDKFEGLQISWHQMHDYFWSDRRQLTQIMLTSIFIWFLHLFQIWLFILALNATAPLLASLALSPLAILAGLLPLTFAGMGTRDAALIALYQPYFAAPTAAALGLLATSRYLLPAIAGIPFLGRYFSLARQMKREKMR